jgi:hypothetical protein
VLLLVACFALFGVGGIAVWAIQMLWIPFWAAGVVNGLGHWWGYRNFETADTATNLTPWGVWIGGEELHNNHHAFPSPRPSSRCAASSSTSAGPRSSCSSSSAWPGCCAWRRRWTCARTSRCPMPKR